MSSSISISVKSEESSTYNSRILQLSATRPKQMALALSRLFRDMASSRHRGVVTIAVGASAPVRASGTLTLVSCATDTCTIGGVTFTGSSSPSGEEQFETDGTDTADAAALTAKINAHSTLALVVSATSSAGVVTITAHAPGTIGQLIDLTETGTTITASAATLTGGAGGSAEDGTVVELGLEA